MPTSSDLFKGAILEHIRYVVWNHLPRDSKILDVGPGIGFYGSWLQDFYVDAVEIHQPYIEMYRLSKYYENVYNSDILDFDYDDYEYIIIGDVLEHIPVKQAKNLIRDITSKKIKCLVAVPFLCPQDAVGGVESEIHHQEDLTPRIMKSRYPDLELFLTNNNINGYAYYTNYYNLKF